MNVAVYARYSSNNQREESIMAQLRAAREYCEKKGYYIVKEYCDEAMTGTNDNRPAFKEMIDAAKSGLFNILICHKIDRFARDRYDDAFYKRTLQKAGVTIEYVEQNIDGSPESIVLESVLVGMAEYYSKNLAREALKGMRENAYQAKHNGGVPPLGYSVKDGKYIINDNEADIVRLIFKMRAAGSGYTDIISVLNSKGYKTKRGGKFGKNSLHDLLRNRKYIGIYTFGRVAGGRSEKRNSHKNDGEMIEIPDAIPRIIDNELWEKVQAKLDADRHTSGKHTAKVEYYLSGKVRCALCGSSMTGGTLVSRGNKYSYYSCSNHERKKDCSGTRIKKEWLEAAVLEYVDYQLLSPEMLPALIEEIKSRMESASNSNAVEKKRLEKQKADTMRKINNLIDFIEDGSADETIKERLKENKILVADINTRLQKIELSSGYILDEEKIRAVLERFQEKEKSPETIRAIVDTFVVSVLVSKEEYIIKLCFSLAWWRRTETLQDENIYFEKVVNR